MSVDVQKLMARLIDIVDALANRPHPADVQVMQKCAHDLGNRILKKIEDKESESTDPTAVAA